MSFAEYRQWDHIVRSNLELFSVDQMKDTFTITTPVQTEKSVFKSVTDPLLRMQITRMEYVEKFVYSVNIYRSALTATNKVPKFTHIGTVYYDEADVGTIMYSVKTILEYMIKNPIEPRIRYLSIQAVFGMLLSGFSKYSPSFGTRTENTVICTVKPATMRASHLRFTLARSGHDVLEYRIRRPASGLTVVDDASGLPASIEIYPNVVVLSHGHTVSHVFAAPLYILICMMHEGLYDRYHTFRRSMQSMTFPTTEIDNVRLYDVKNRTRFLTTTSGKITVSEKKSSSSPEKVKESYKMEKNDGC